MTSITGQKISTAERVFNVAEMTGAGTSVGVLAMLVRYGRKTAPVLDIVKGITKKHGLFKCVECADELMAALGKLGVQAKKVEIYGPGRNGIIISNAMGGKVISQGGRHFGVEVDGIVFCNIHKNGLPYAEWIKDFDSATGITVLP